MLALKQTQTAVVETLWQLFTERFTYLAKIFALFSSKITLDHLAIIDLPSQHTGINTLNQLFAALNYLPQGRDYLPDKQNEFMWLTPAENFQLKASESLPQIVIADFQIEALPIPIRDIIYKYTLHIKPFPWLMFHNLCGRMYKGDHTARLELTKFIATYCQRRDWPLPTAKEFYSVKEANELLAWVLIFGRQPNHFGISVHLVEKFSSLVEFNHWIKTHAIELNQQQGEIKGTKEKGIAQSATVGQRIKLQLEDGIIALPGPFIEFVWRFSEKSHPEYWSDYFTGFIGNQANYVIESVYESKMV